MEDNIEKNIWLYKQLLEDNLIIEFKFTGNSMSPIIQNQSTILVQKITTIEIGKIYVYFDTISPTLRLVCHRLIKITNGQLFFKGDNRDIFDSPITIDEIIGVVVEIKNKN